MKIFAEKYRIPYFNDIASYRSHLGYAKWRGSEDRDLELGKLGDDDQIFRQIITLEEACRKGADQFIDHKEIKAENDAEEYSQLYNCQFLDGNYSIFQWNRLQDCMVEPLDWDDMILMDDGQLVFDPDKPVYAGFDPAVRPDAAKFLLIAAPDEKHRAYRLVHETSWKAATQREMIDEIIDICNRFNVTQFAVDQTGFGEFITQLISEFYPTVQAIYEPVYLVPFSRISKL